MNGTTAEPTNKTRRDPIERALQLKSPAPNRPVDGLSLRPLIVDGTMTERPSPIGIWKYSAGGEQANGPWIPDAALSRGTTPTTRTPSTILRNYRHPVAKTEDFTGSAAWTDNRYKLVATGGKNGAYELYDLRADPQEKNEIAAQNPEIVQRMTQQLHMWQRSVERSLSGADY